jgi:hypothetical protein
MILLPAEDQLIFCSDPTHSRRFRVRLFAVLYLSRTMRELRYHWQIEAIDIGRVWAAGACPPGTLATTATAIALRMLASWERGNWQEETERTAA